MKSSLTNYAGRGAGIAAVVLLCAMTAASGIAYRQADSGLREPEVARIVARMAQFPERIGGWPQNSAPALGENVIRELRCQGYVNREYDSDATRRAAHALILVGPPGTIAAHTPEICYGTRDYEVLGSPERVDFQDAAGKTHQLWLTRIRRRDVSAQVLRVYHAWMADSVWRASENPRLDYTFAPLLAKCQVAFVDLETPQSVAEEREFLSAFVNATNEYCSLVEPAG